MTTVEIDNQALKNDIRNHNGSVRSSFRRILIDFSEELAESLRREFSEHDTGVSGTMDSIESDIGSSAWERNVVMNDTALFVEHGAEPHAAPIENLKPYADKKGLDVGALWYTIKEKGQQPHPFMNRAFDNVDLESIIIKNINR